MRTSCAASRTSRAFESAVRTASSKETCGDAAALSCPCAPDNAGKESTRSKTSPNREIGREYMRNRIFRTDREGKGECWAGTLLAISGAKIRNVPGGGPQKGPRPFRPVRREGWNSAVEVEEELVRRRPHLDGVDLGVDLVLDPLLDDVRREDVALEQEVVIVLQGLQRLLQRARRGRDVGQLLGGEGVDVLVERLAPVDLFLDAVPSRHQHRRECDVAVAGRVGGPELRPLRLPRRRVHRDPDRRGAVPAAVDPVNPA